MKLQSFARCAGEGILAFVASASFFALTNAQRNPVWFLLLAALAFIGIRSLRSGWASLNAKQRALCVAFAVIFSATTLAGGKVVVGEAGHYSGGMEDVYILPFQPLDGLWTAALAVMALSLLMCARSLMGRYSRWLAQSGGQAAAGKGSFFLYWFLIFLCWSPYLFAYYPGLLYGDSAYCIEQALNGITNNNSPVFYNLLLRLFLTVGNAISSHEFGCFLYTLFQTLIISAAFSYTVVWLQRKGCRRFYCWLSLAFFALTPLMPMHAISMWKDPLYSIALLLLSLLTYDIAASQGELLLRKSIVFRLCAYTLAVCLIRNNGVLAMLPYWLCLFLIYRPLCKAQKKAARCFLAGLCTLLLFLGVYGPVYQLLGIYNPFVESISVPLQQMARVEAYEGNRTEEQHTFLSTLLAEPYQQAYTPCCAGRRQVEHSV